MKLPNQSVGVKRAASAQADSPGIVPTSVIDTPLEGTGLIVHCVPVPYGIPSLGIYGYKYLCLAIVAGKQIG